MIQVRNGVFESNSSSVHAIVVSDNDVELNYNPSVVFSIGSFGWEMGVLDDMWERASYLYTAACELYEHDVADELCERLGSLGIVCDFETKPNFEKYEFNDKVHYFLDNGGIDHVDECKEFVEYLWNDTNALVRFLCNDESFIITGNDNCYDEDIEWRSAKITKADAYPHKIFWKGN